MLSISPIIFFPRASFRLQNQPVQSVTETKENIVSKFVSQTASSLVDTWLFNQRPKGSVDETAHILRRISNQVLEAAELKQVFENRKALQENIAEDIFDLKTALEKFSKDDLKLFAAYFQNQPVFGPVSFDTNQNLFDSDFLSDGATGNFPENLFRIDVTSESGILAALNLTNRVLNVFSPRSSGYRGL